MAITLANLLIKVRADTATLATDLKKVAGEGATLGRRIGQTEIPVRKLAVGLAAVVAAGAGIAVVSQRILALGASVEETANKFNVVMGRAADEMRQKLQELTKTIPLMLGEMEALAAGIQDMLVPLGIARSEAANMSVDMVKLAGDLASFNNVAASIPLDAIKSALAGSSRPLRQFGVDVSDTRLKALALSEGIVRVGEELTSAARAQAVMIAVQRDSSDAMGDAARTADSASNQLRFMQRDARQLKEDLAVALIPALLELVRGLRSAIERADGLAEALREITVAWLDIAGVVNQTTTIEIAGITRALKDMTEAQKEAFLLSRLRGAAAEYNRVHAEVERLNAAVMEMTGPAGVGGTRLMSTVAELDELQHQLEAAGQVMNEISRLMVTASGEMASGFDETATAVGRTADELDRAHRAAERMRNINVRITPPGTIGRDPLVTRDGRRQLVRGGPRLSGLPTVEDLSGGIRPTTFSADGLPFAEVDAFAHSLGNVASEARGATDSVSSIVRGFEMLDTEGATTADKILGAGGVIAGVMALGQALFGSGAAIAAAAREVERAMESLEFGLKEFAGTATEQDRILRDAARLAQDISQGGIQIQSGVDLEEALRQGLSFEDVFGVSGRSAFIELHQTARAMGISVAEFAAMLEAQWDELTQATADRLANLGDETEKTADAMAELAGILNAPRGFKVALRRFQSSAPEDVRLGNDLGDLGDGTVHHTTIVTLDGRVIGEAVDEYAVFRSDTGRSPNVRR